MAITVPSRSAQYESYQPAAGGLPGKVASSDWGSKLRVSYCKLTITAAGFTTPAAGDMKYLRLPAGKIRIYSDLSRVICPAGAVGSDLDLGNGSYIKADGTTQALQGISLADSLDAGAAIDAALPLPANGIYEIESREGVDIVGSFDTANSPAAGDIHLSVVYQMGN